MDSTSDSILAYKLTKDTVTLSGSTYYNLEHKKLHNMHACLRACKISKLP